jgi:hypothetical protein
MAERGQVEEVFIEMPQDLQGQNEQLVAPPAQNVLPEAPPAQIVQPPGPPVQNGQNEGPPQPAQIMPPAGPLDPNGQNEEPPAQPAPIPIQDVPAQLVNLTDAIRQLIQAADTSKESMNSAVLGTRQAINNLADRHVSHSSVDPSLAPKKFAGGVTEDASRFIDDFNLYTDYRGLSPEAKLKVFPLYLASGPRIWLKTYLDSKPKASLADLQTKFLERFGPAARGFVSRFELMNRVQLPGESVADYTEDMMSRLSLSGCQDPEAWSQYCRGLRPRIRAAVLREKPSNLDEACSQARQAEQFLALEDSEVSPKVAYVGAPNGVTNALLSLGNKLEELTKKVTETRESRDRNQGPPHQPSRNNRGNKFCDFCKKHGHIDTQCRSKNGACFGCGGRDHLIRDCPRSQGQPHRYNGNRIQNNDNSGWVNAHVPPNINNPFQAMQFPSQQGN